MMQLIGTALILVEILGYVLILHRFFSMPYGIGTSLFTAATAIFLYCADFAGAMKSVSIAIHGGGLAAFAVVVGLSLRTGGKQVGLRPTKTAIGAAAILLLTGLLYWRNRSGAFFSWDEFSHWGTIIKVMVEANTFHLVPNPLYFQDYPPGTALFSYHVLQLTGYSEGNAYFSYALLMMCFLTGLILSAFAVGPLWGLGTVALTFTAVTAFGAGWSNVLIDHILSVVFAGSLVAYLISQREGHGRFAIAILLGYLALLKQSGAALALVGAAVCAADLLILRFYPRPSAVQTGGRSGLADAAWVASLFAVPIALSSSWKHYVDTAALGKGWGSFSIGPSLAKAQACCRTPVEIEIAQNYFAKFFGVTAGTLTEGTLLSFAMDAISRVELTKLLTLVYPLPPFSVLLAITLATAIVLYLCRSTIIRVRLTVFQTMLLGGAIAYSGSILLTYLYAFSEYEGRQITSFVRFHDVYLLALVLLMVFVVTCLFSSTRKTLLTRASIVVITCCAIAGGYKSLRAFARDGATQMQPLRASIRLWTEDIKPLIPARGRTYIIWQESNGFEFWMVKHELLPRLTNLDCYSLGARFRPDDVWTCPRDEATLTKDLGEFDYVAVGHGLGSLRVRYPELFRSAPSGTEAALFRIDQSGGKLRLDLVKAGRVPLS